MKKLARSRRSAFTLVEILVVLAIIGILSAFLFPAFGRARESARQTNCISNLQQIGVAVQQYYQDTKRYPDSIVDLLPDGAKYLRGGVEETIGGEATLPTRGTGYLKGGADALLCSNDDVDTLHSSYGALEKFPTTPATLTTTDIPGRYVFNYWGYRTDGFSFADSAAAATAGNANKRLLRNPDPALLNVYDAKNNPIKYSLSNRYAPASTIITHCVYHRPNTANDIALPIDLYATPAVGDSKNARDIVLRLDNSAKAVDVTTWNTGTPALWQVQK